MSVIGLILSIVAVAIAGWTASVLGWSRMIGWEVGPPHPALPQLVLAGPYQFVRHPRVLAIVLISLGAGMRHEPVPMWLCATIAALALLAGAWRDRQLRARFGEAYRRYQKAVPFLVPRLPPSS
jgi:protein-S-isoprenylcysteine O-methyltransferase Ste14